MSGNPNLPRARRKRVLLVTANPSVSTTLGWPVGAWGSEFTHPWLAFTEAGYEVEFASPKGGKVELDPLSDPRHESGYSADDLVTLGFLSSPKHAALLEQTLPVAQADPARYDALVIAGGQSPMFTFRGDADLTALVRAFYDAEKVTAALCHGVAALVDVTLADGTPLVAGKTVTGFSNAEERFADQYVGQRVMPWWIEDALREKGANYVSAGLWTPFAVRDGRLVTGQQQYSGGRVAELVIEALGY